MGLNTTKSANKDLLYIMSCVVLFFYVILATNAFTFLRADGCANIIKILTNKNFYTYDVARNWGLIIKQVFAVLPIKYLGLRDIKVIIALLSFGYSFWTALFYFLTLQICKKKNNRVAMLCTMFVFSCQIIFCGFSLITEAILSAAVFWFLLVFLLCYNEEENSQKEYLLFVGACILGYSLYASMFVMYFFLIIVLTLKIRLKQIKFTAKCGLAYVLFGVGFFVNLSYGLRTSSAKDSWFESLMHLPKSFFIIICTLVILGFTSLFIKNKSLFSGLKKEQVDLTNRKQLKKICAVVEVVLCVEIIYVSLTEGVWLAGINFLTRSLNLFVPLMIGTFLSIIMLLELKLPENIYARGAFAFVVSALISYTMATTSYTNYLKTVNNVTVSQNGYVSAKTCNIIGNEFYDNWSMACASIFASALYSNNDYIHGVVVQEKEYITSEPFDSHDIYAYPDLTEYNIFYVFESFQ